VRVEKVLMSACLLGERVRYDGRGFAAGECLARWTREGRVVPLCPEVAGGLPVPRPPAEIRGGAGAEVLSGRAQLTTREGLDVTGHFLAGARIALETAQRERVRVAVLKARSPSCGTGRIYDGTFTGTLREGDGTTAALLRAHGIEVFDESQLDEVDARLASLER
jgi:uncharacterized protein YbbK (DUF523 family)